MICTVWAAHYTGAYSEPCQASKMGRFAKTVNGHQPLTIFAKRSLLDVSLSSEYASGSYSI